MPVSAFPEIKDLFRINSSYYSTNNTPELKFYGNRFVIDIYYFNNFVLFNLEVLIH
jgi:hypothetical protein